jgi:hypothetical protein
LPSWCRRSAAGWARNVSNRRLTLRIDGTHLSSVSIGIAVSPHDGDNADDLLRPPTYALCREGELSRHVRFTSGR